MKETVHILLCGFYFQGNTGDDLFMEKSIEMLSRYGEVRVTSTETFDKDLLDWCELLVVGPGSHITPRGLGAYHHVKYVKEQSKKVFFYSLTVEEGQSAMLEHLARADMITVRDSESKKVVEMNGFRAVLASDPLFKKARRTIGFSFRKWVNEPDGIEDMLAVVLDNLSRDYDILSVPYTTNQTDTEADDIFHQGVIDRMKYKPHTVSYDEAINKIDLLLAMRLHALINAVNRGRKILAIDYDAKVGRILADLGMGNFDVPYGKINDIPRIIRENIFASDNLAQRAKVNEALIARMCVDMKDEPAPLMSIAMPTYNRAAYLKDAIDSIINQTMADWELIVIDDGSSDGTAELVASCQDKRIKYFNFGHNGISFSRNMGSLLSRGKIIVVADSDDINLPERLALTLKEMEGTGADILYASMYFLFEDGRRELVPSHPFSLERLKKGNFLYHPTVAYRREVAMACPYDEGIEVSEDYDMYLRVAEKGYVFHQVEQPLVLYRVHDDQISLERKGDVAEIHDNIVALNRERILEGLLLDKDTLIGNLESHVRNLQEAMHHKDVHIGDLEEALREKDETLHNIYSSHGWKLLFFYYKMRDRLLPDQSRRRKAVKFLWNLLSH